jgi:hypothetical protein
VINVFVQRWLAALPQPFTDADRDAGYWWETSMRQVEFARTIVFDAPRHARGFFEALIADNLDLGRPHNVEIIFNRRIRRDTPGTFRTAIDRRDNGGVVVNVFYKHSRVKQYLKDGRAMRIETVINAPRDVGDPRVMALTGALCQTLLAATGFTNKSLRALITGLLGSDYRPNQMTYDLRRLRLAGLIRRLPHTNHYTLTGDGIRIAVAYTKIYNRLLVPLTAANQPQAPHELRHALHTLDQHVDDYIARARLKPAI